LYREIGEIKYEARRFRTFFDYVGNALFGNYDYAYVKLRFSGGMKCIGVKIAKRKQVKVI
jgi:hypothetical protein